MSSSFLRDELEVSFAEKVLKLADKNGRVIPHRDLKNAVCNPDKNFHLVQPKLGTPDDYSVRVNRFQEAFNPKQLVSAIEFRSKVNELIGELKDNRKIANLLNGVFLPIILPRLESLQDYGETLEKIFLPAVKFSYEKQFPDRKFYNYQGNELVGKVSIVPETRHERLIERIAQKFVVAIYFPNPLQGFSVLASREQLCYLPESVLLVGGIDTATAIAMYPDVLARDWYTPGLDLSALLWQSPDYSLFFGALDDALSFDDGGVLVGAGGSYSSGLLFLGSA